jgi:hypothetical protein
MSQVVINEFEIVPAPPSPETGEAGADEAPGPAAPGGRSPVLDAERVARWLGDRSRRVRAH